MDFNKEQMSKTLKDGGANLDDMYDSFAAIHGVRYAHAVRVLANLGGFIKTSAYFTSQVTNKEGYNDYTKLLHTFLMPTAIKGVTDALICMIMGLDVNHTELNKDQLHAYKSLEESLDKDTTAILARIEEIEKGLVGSFKKE